jgi:hypothetical protein
MADLDRAALIEKAARAIWHASGGAEVWETLDEDDEHRDIALTEAEAALEAAGFFGPAQDGWQDIETAPRDGTWIVVVDRQGNYEACRYEPYYSYSFEEVSDGLYRKVRHEPGAVLNWPGSSNFHRATHWRPLPAPPSTEREG